MNSASTDGLAGSTLGVALFGLTVVLAYCGGIVLAGVGAMSAVSIAGRSFWSSPILGDYELVEIGIAVAGSLFLPYCQVTRGHIVVDFFTLKASPSVIRWLDRFGSLLMAVALLVVAWRTVVGCVDILRSGETSMLMGVPIWIGYAAAVPGVCIAGVVALAQAAGVAFPGASVESAGYE
ncbi:MAG: TRAP transporter small permease [Bradyrhizobiaceae bacterium]|nr:TRAP transporter small permease [Bradyrhizobiaceae bacterium]